MYLTQRLPLVCKVQQRYALEVKCQGLIQLKSVLWVETPTPINHIHILHMVCIFIIATKVSDQRYNLGVN